MGGGGGPRRHRRGPRAVLLHREPRRSGSDLTPNGAFVAALGPGQQACQDGELLPADTSAVRLTIGTYGLPGPPLQVTFTGPHGEAAELGVGSPAAGARGSCGIPIAHVCHAHRRRRVPACATSGPQRIALAGDLPDPGYDMQVAGHAVEGRLRYDYLRPGSESWLELLPAIVHRLSLAQVRPRAPLGVGGGAGADALRRRRSPSRTILREEPVERERTGARLDGARLGAHGRAPAGRRRRAGCAGPRGRPGRGLGVRARDARQRARLVADRAAVRGARRERPLRLRPAGRRTRRRCRATSARRASSRRREDATLATIGFYQIVGEPQNPAPMSELQQQADRSRADARV